MFQIFRNIRERLSPPPTNQTDVLAAIKKLDMKISEAIQLVQDLRATLIKAKGEIIGKIARLENADGDLTPAQSAAMEDLRATVHQLDDVVPDDPAAPGAPLHTEEVQPGAAALPLNPVSSEVPLGTGDTMPSGEEDDSLGGGDGNDTLDAGDTLAGGEGNDTMPAPAQ